MTKAIRKSASPIVLSSIIATSVVIVATNLSATDHHVVFAQLLHYNNTTTKLPVQHTGKATTVITMHIYSPILSG
ncbi:MAG TPA: hypothetical protein VFI73_08095 [Candidatus Nitrosopolaris sp.]|nr:hypothetical protein [Candidatus Nitrosopolaris sp.]